MDESARHGHRRHRRPSVCRHRPAVPRRAGRRLPLQLVEHALESFARTSGCTLHLAGTGRNDHHLAEAAFKALGRAPARRLRARPPADRGRVDQGLARMTSRPRIAVIDYGAGNLVSIEQALTSVGATVELVGDPEALRGCDALDRARRRRGRPGDGAARQAGLAEPDPRLAARRPAIPRDLPGSPAPVRLQRRGRGARRSARSRG